MNLKKYLKIYKILAVHNFSILIVSRLDFALLLIGKIIQSVLEIIVIETVFTQTNSLLGYSRGEVFLFYAIFNLANVIMQALFYRGFWFTQRWVETGEFDHFLKYPVSEKFINAFKVTDWIDITNIIPALAIFGYALNIAGPFPTTNWITFGVAFLSGLAAAFAILMSIAALNFFTPQAAPIHSIFRELARSTRFPITIYPKSLESFLTFVVPVALMSYVPTTALLGNLSFNNFALVPIFATLLVLLAIKFWNYALGHYSSASS